VLSVEQILRRLDDRFTLLNSTDQRLPERQRTMRAVVEWSHALLTDAEKALLRRLSIFANWSLAKGFPNLTPGQHTFAVRATSGMLGMSCAFPANVSSDSSPRLQGNLTVMILNR